MAEYIYSTSDSSFDYEGPFGVATQNEISLNGFEIDMTDDYPHIETLKGFGAHYDVEKCKTLKDFMQYLLDNCEFIQANNSFCTPQEMFDELLKFTQEAIEMENKKNAKCCT